MPDALNFAQANGNVGLARVLLEESCSLGQDWICHESAASSISALWAALVDGCAEVIMLLYEFAPVYHRARSADKAPTVTQGFWRSFRYSFSAPKKYWYRLGMNGTHRDDSFMHYTPLRVAYALHGTALCSKMLELGYRPLEHELYQLLLGRLDCPTELVVLIEELQLLEVCVQIRHTLYKYLLPLMEYSSHSDLTSLLLRTRRFRPYVKGAQRSRPSTGLS